MRRMKLFIYFLSGILLITLVACQPITTAPTPAAPASSAPRLTVREATNCRTGPRTEYDIVFTYSPGTQLEITGRADSGDFWLVKSDQSPTGTCWMWNGSVEVTGNYGGIANATPPPTPTNVPVNTSGDHPPDAPSLQNWDYACDNDTMTFTVIWRDRATDETGYRVFRDGKLLVELPPDSTTYTDTLPKSPDVKYYIQVYSPGGTADSSVMKAGC